MRLAEGCPPPDSTECRSIGAHGEAPGHSGRQVADPQQSVEPDQSSVIAWYRASHRPYGGMCLISHTFTRGQRREGSGRRNALVTVGFHAVAAASTPGSTRPYRDACASRSRPWPAAGWKPQAFGRVDQRRIEAGDRPVGFLAGVFPPEQRGISRPIVAPIPISTVGFISPFGFIGSLFAFAPPIALERGVG